MFFTIGETEIHLVFENWYEFNGGKKNHLLRTKIKAALLYMLLFCVGCSSSGIPFLAEKEDYVGKNGEEE